jgi:hypothetical protein
MLSKNKSMRTDKMTSWHPWMRWFHWQWWTFLALGWATYFVPALARLVNRKINDV